MRLVIAEKPSLGRAIAQALGGFVESPSKRFLSNQKDCIITWGIGHLVEQYYPLTQDINQLPMLPKDDEWELRVINRDGYVEQFAAIEELANSPAITEIVNACDAGREGELIGRLIYNKCNTNKPLKRMWINSMTKGKLRKAYAEICDAKKYDGLSKAAFCRSQADWCVGLNGSIAATIVMNRKENMAQATAIGRVKNVVAALVVNREREINSFVPEKFWEINAEFLAKSENENYIGKWVNYTELLAKREKAPKEDDSDANVNEEAAQAGGDSDQEDDNEEQEETNSLYRFKDEQKVKSIIAECLKGKVSNVVESKKLRKKNPPHLFDLGTIQYLANKLYKLNADKTLDLIQELYEKHQAVTYPRTDSTHLPKDYPQECIEILDKLSKAEKIEEISDLALEAKARVNEVGKHIFDDSKISDHFAIIPTGVIPNLGTNKSLKQIYYLIVKRFKEAFLPPLEYYETERFTFIGEHVFRSVGIEVIELGWTIIEKKELERADSKKTKNKDVILPKVKDASDINIVDIKAPSKKTTPKKRYNNGTLLRTMMNISRILKGAEKEALREAGIGTPATRSSIIKELHDTVDSRGRPKKAMLEERGNSKEIHPTEYGIKVIEFLEECGIKSLLEPELTARFEISLESIVDDENKSIEFMQNIYSMVSDLVDKIKKANANIPIRKLANTSCPKCNSDLIIEPRLVSCDSCTYKIGRIVANKVLNNEDLSLLIKNGVTPVIHGFISMDGNKQRQFSSALKRDVDAEGNEVVKFYIPKEVYKHNCPICNSKVMKSFMSSNCENQQCGFKVWTQCFGASLTDTHIEQLFLNHKTEQIDSFLSKTKGNYSGKLQINFETKKVEMSFDGVEKPNNDQQTKLKCVTATCSGLYIKSDYKYVCNTCEKYFFYKQKNQKPLSDAQIRKLLKGETILHPFSVVNDDGSSKTTKHEYYFNKNGYLQHKEKEEG